ncbi:hypothetical protein BH09MYX1_BH09MYX1_41990 [soil metagenome]
MSQERRQHRRIFLRVDLDFACGHNFFRGKTRDLSVGGLFIETTASIPIGTVLSIDLRFLKRNLRVNAVATWENRERGRVVGVGIQFVDLPESASRAIQAFMALREPLQVDA